MKKFVSYDEVVEKLKSEELLNEDDIEAILWNSDTVDETYGDIHEWEQNVSTVVSVYDEKWQIDWKLGLQKDKGNKFEKQPFRVQ